MKLELFLQDFYLVIIFIWVCEKSLFPWQILCNYCMWRYRAYFNFKNIFLLSEQKIRKRKRKTRNSLWRRKRLFAQVCLKNKDGGLSFHILWKQTSNMIFLELACSHLWIVAIVFLFIMMKIKHFPIFIYKHFL